VRIVRSTRKPVAALLLIWLSACATAGRWNEVAVTPQPTRRTLYAGSVRVTTSGGTVYAFRGAWVGPDSLGGWLVEPAGAELSFALGDVTRLEVRGAPRQAQSPGIEGDGDQKWFMILLGAYFAVGIVGGIIYARNWGCCQWQ